MAQRQQINKGAILPEAYSEYSHASKMEIFEKIVNGF